MPQGATHSVSILLSLTHRPFTLGSQEEDAVVVDLDAKEQLTFTRVPQGATHSGAKALESAVAAASAVKEEKSEDKEAAGEKGQGS